MQKHVLLYLSGFNSIDSEILSLNYIHDRLEENPKEVIKGFKKKDFKILCIPIVDNKDDSAKIKLICETLKKYIKCYAVEHFSELPGLRLIKEELNYSGKPIMPVLTPTGDMMNEDAMDLIFRWEIEAFPFRKIDGEDLSLKWKWFWDLEGSKYIFIYGGENRKWIQNLALALDKIKGHETIQKVDGVIEHYQLGKNDPDAISCFWKEIEIEKASNLGSEIQEKMESLLCLKGDPHGWVVLSKGSNVKILDHMEPMCETVMDFEIWKDNVLRKEGFDMALRL
ncbi:Sieve element occlusion [Stylosanthes scabra]|uniref:Sieve element occlusion n=1 Tax=Stylosanthes scabra TaxID=79078 RepID=A0ABU6QB96_9FABA|nr:Sieve element occlusion [Stylosanthes scabra]